MIDPLPPRRPQQRMFSSSLSNVLSRKKKWKEVKSMDHMTAIQKNLAFLPTEALYAMIRVCVDELEKRGKKHE